MLIAKQCFTLTPSFLSKNKVTIVASLPCYEKENVDKQRGKGVFERSILGLKQLNELGYGKKGNDLFLNLVKNNLNITFANEQEILSLTNSKNFNDVISFGKQLGKLLVITRGEKGSVAIQKNEVFDCNSKKNLKIVDLKVPFLVPLSDIHLIHLFFLGQCLHLEAL